MKDISPIKWMAIFKLELKKMEAYRRKGYGKLLMEEMEKRAREMGVNTIRLDTFS